MGISVRPAPFGSQVATGAGTWFDDLRVAPNARTSGNNAPSFSRIQRDNAGTSNGVYAYAFDNAAAENQKEIYFGVQMPHGKLLDSPLHLHVHWVPVTAGTAGHTVRWGLEYTWTNIGEAFPKTTTVYQSTRVGGAIDVALSHCLTEFPDLTPPTTETLSSIIQCRLFRDSAHSEDTATVTAGLLFIDAHVEMSLLGSRDEFAQ